MNRYSGISDLNSGDLSFTVNQPGMSSTKAKSAMAQVMKQGPGASNIHANADWTSISPVGADFHFTSPIPDDGTVYKICYSFDL